MRKSLAILAFTILGITLLSSVAFAIEQASIQEISQIKQGERQLKVITFISGDNYYSLEMSCSKNECSSIGGVKLFLPEQKGETIIEFSVTYDGKDVRLTNCRLNPVSTSNVEFVQCPSHRFNFLGWNLLEYKNGKSRIDLEIDGKSISVPITYTF